MTFVDNEVLRKLIAEFDAANNAEITAFENVHDFIYTLTGKVGYRNIALQIIKDGMFEEVFRVLVTRDRRLKKSGFLFAACNIIDEMKKEESRA